MCLLITLQLIAKEPEALPTIEPLTLLHHTIVLLGVLSLSITQSRCGAVDKRLESDRPSMMPLFAEIKLKVLKHKGTGTCELVERSGVSSSLAASLESAKPRNNDSGQSGMRSTGVRHTHKQMRGQTVQGRCKRKRQTKQRQICSQATRNAWLRLP